MSNKNSNNLTNCDYCDSCDSCDSCYYCDSCNYSKGLRMSEYMIFCLGEGKYESKGIGYQKNHHAFNKQVTKERYKEILKIVREILKDLKLELNTKDWSDEWKKVTNEQWKKLSEIPEFDKEVVEGIIGFELPEEDEKVTIKISKKSLEALKDSGIEIIK